MKKIIILFLIFIIFKSFGQVGIGTNTPANTAMLEVSSNNKGFLLPRMTSAQRSAIVSPVNGLQVYDTNTNSIWYFNGTYWVNTLAMASAGDVKSGVQSADHSGWILLDGRALSTLSANQQAVAITLGFSGNLPNANNAYLVQNGSTMASVSGSNTVTLTHANLPNVNFTGTTASAGDHTHSVDPAPVYTSTNGNHSHGSNANGNNIGLAYKDCYGTPSGIDFSCGEINNFVTMALSIYAAGDHNHTVDIPATNSTLNGSHTHNVSVSSGGSNTPINIAPKSLSVNMFIYLGL